MTISEILTDIIKDADLKIVFERSSDDSTLVVGLLAKLLRPRSPEGPFVLEHVHAEPLSNLLCVKSIGHTGIREALREFRQRIEQASRI